MARSHPSQSERLPPYYQAANQWHPYAPPTSRASSVLNAGIWGAGIEDWQQRGGQWEHPYRDRQYRDQHSSEYTFPSSSQQPNAVALAREAAARTSNTSHRPSYDRDPPSTDYRLAQASRQAASRPPTSSMVPSAVRRASDDSDDSPPTANHTKKLAAAAAVKPPYATGSDFTAPGEEDRNSPLQQSELLSHMDHNDLASRHVVADAAASAVKRTKNAVAPFRSPPSDTFPSSAGGTRTSWADPPGESPPTTQVLAAPPKKAMMSAKQQRDARKLSTGGSADEIEKMMQEPFLDWDGGDSPNGNYSPRPPDSQQHHANGHQHLVRTYPTDAPQEQ